MIVNNHNILRYYVPIEGRDEHLAELIRTCEQTGAQEVSLFSSDYLCHAVFLAPTEMEQRMEHLALCAEAIREAGLIFSLNVMHTLGHLFVPQTDIDRFGFQRQLDAEGRPGAHPVLDPACPKLREHLVETYRQYARLQPRLLFVDDDFLVPFHQCFLLDRVTRFATAFGCQDSPAAVQDALHTGEHTNQKRARELMAELITADLIALATALREAVHEISPTTRLGLMYPTHMMGVEQVARALAGDHQPFVRPQIPLYREDVPTMAYPSRFQTVDIWQAQLPADFEFYPEGENYPYDPALKSPSAALLHHMYCLAVGESQVALSLNSFSAGIPACESTALVDKFTAYRGQIATVNELLDTDRQTIKTVGATVWQHSEASQLGLLEGPNLLPLQARGVPVSYVRNPEDAVLHWGNSLAHLSDEELEGVLQRGAVFDGRAVEILEQRGLLESTGLSLGEKCRVTDVLHIRYERNDQGHENWPFYYFVSRMPGDDHLPRRMSAPDSTTICPYLDDKGNISAPHILTWTSPSGVRFGLLNVLASRLDKALLSPWSTPAIVRAIEWVQDAPLTACAAGGGNVLLKALRLRSGSQLMLTLANLSTSPSSPLPIRLAPKYVTWRWSKVGANGEREPLEVNSKGQLPAPLLQCLEHSIFLGECLSERDRTAMKLPIDYLAHPETDARLRKHLGVTTENELLDALGSDFFYLPGRDISQNEGFLPFYKKRDSLAMSATERTCPLGIRWQRGAYDSKFAVDEALAGPFGNPMVSSREILDYPWPRAEDFDFSPLIDVAERNRDRTRIGGLWTGIMGDSYRMHGFENFLLNLAMNPDIVHTLIDRMTEMYLELNNAYFSTLKGNLEIWFFGNDFGSQESLLMSVDMWADYFYDNIRKLCALAHSYGLRVMMHSCGAIRELIPLLIEAGVDILDPIQVTAKGMEPDTLATEFGGRITFHGGIDTQRVLPTATPGDVTDHVRHTVATLGATGRYIFAPSQILGPDIPVENIAAMYRAARALNTERVTITDYA